MAQFVDLSGQDPIFEGLSRGLASLPGALQERKRLKESIEGLRSQFPEATEEQLRGIAQLDPRSRAKMIEGQQEQRTGQDISQAFQQVQEPEMAQQPQLGDERTAPFLQQQDTERSSQLSPEKISEALNSLKESRGLSEDDKVNLNELSEYFGDKAQAQNVQTPETPQVQPIRDQTPNNDLTNKKIPTAALELNDYQERDPEAQRYQRELRKLERAKENVRTTRARDQVDKQIDRIQAKRDKRYDRLEKQYNASQTKYNKFLDNNKDYINKIETSAQEAEEDRDTLGRMEELSKSGELNSRTFTSILQGLGEGSTWLKPLGNLATAVMGGLNPDSEEFRNLSKSFIKNAKSLFGSNVTNADLKQFMDTIPTLMQTPDGRQRIINRMQMMNEAKDLKNNILQDIKQKNHGILPNDFKQKVEREDKKERKKLGDQFKKKSLMDSVAENQREAREYEAAPITTRFQREGLGAAGGEVIRQGVKGFRDFRNSDAFRDPSREEVSNLMQNLSQNTGGGALSGLLRALGPEGEADPMERINYAEQQRQRNLPTLDQYVNQSNRRQRNLNNLADAFRPRP